VGIGGAAGAVVYLRALAPDPAGADDDRSSG
jgi:hypothetical protein